MAEAKAIHVKAQLESMLQFIDPLMPLVNSHMVNFITSNLWEHIPTSLKDQVSEINEKEFYEIMWQWGEKPLKFSNTTPLGLFLQQCAQMSLHEGLSDIVLSLQDLKTRLTELGSESGMSLLPSIDYFMSPKKIHEVEVLTKVVAATSELSNASCVIDIGGGKGYLGSCLAVQEALRVLSIDSNAGNTNGAAHLSKKIEDYGQKKREKTKKNLSEKCFSHLNEAPQSGTIEQLYKQVTGFVTCRTDLASIALEHFPLNSEPHCDAGVQPERHALSLVGLHTCGNLAASSLQIFCTNKDVVSLCNVGCCYNLLTERFHSNDSIKEQQTKSPIDDHSDNGFPLSQFLNQKKFALGKNARMLAAQSVDRISHGKRVMPDSLYYRAALQVFLDNHFGPDQDHSVGRLGSKASSLFDYFLKAQQRLHVDMGIGVEKLTEFDREHGHNKILMEIFTMLRIAVAPVVESIILLDRILYLYEQGLEHSYLTQLFDPVVSPRCYGIIALKT